LQGYFAASAALNREIVGSAILDGRDIGSIPVDFNVRMTFEITLYTFEFSTLTKETVIPLFSCRFSAASEKSTTLQRGFAICPPFVGIKPD
jgi:hypothetical protein